MEPEQHRLYRYHAGDIYDRPNRRLWADSDQQLGFRTPAATSTLGNT